MDKKDYLVYTGAAIGAATVAHYLTKSPPKIDPLYDFDQQSIEIDVFALNLFISIFDKSDQNILGN